MEIINRALVEAISKGSDTVYFDPGIADFEEWRQKMGFSQTDMASLLNANRSSYEKWLYKGVKPNPGYHATFRLLNMLSPLQMSEWMEQQGIKK